MRRFYTDERLLADLEQNGVKLKDYYLQDGPCGCVIGHYYKGEPGDMIIDDDQWADEVEDFLRRKKVKIIRYNDDGTKTIINENGPEE